MANRDWDELRRSRAGRGVLEWPLPASRFLYLDSGLTFSLYVEGDLAFHFDPEGRLRRAFLDGRHYLRGLDGKVLRKTRRREGSPSDLVPPIDHREISRVLEEAHASVLAALAALARPDVVSSGGRNDVLASRARERLGRAADFDPRRLLDEARRFLDVYAPPGVLPPDCYRTLILQATSGCSYNRCAFCALYQSVPYRVKSPGEFRAHVRAVREFLGRGLLLRRGVFLGEANALEVPQRQLVEIVEIVQQMVPEVLERGGGIHAFSDVFHEVDKGIEEYRDLRALGLARVYLGIESGSEAVLRHLRKPVKREQVLRRVEILRAAGVPVGLIFLVGAGGRELGEIHRSETLRLLEEIGPSGRDLIYLSPLSWPSPRFAGGEERPPAVANPGRKELEDEESQLRSGLRRAGFRVGHYDIESFVYY